MRNAGTILWLATVAVTSLWVTMMALDREHPYDYDLERTTVSPQPARQNETITVNWGIKVNRLCAGTSQRSLMNMDGRVLTTYDATAAAQSVDENDDKLVRTFRLPAIDLPEDVGYMSEICWRCNMLQRAMPRLFCQNTPVKWFKVAPRDANTANAPQSR